MEKIVVCLGSNFGDRKRNVAEALEWIRENLVGVNDSGIYETPAFGHSGAPYMNAVVSGDCREEKVADFERACKEYESSHGRDAEARRNNHVPIDIDIVKAGNRILRYTDFNCEFFQIGYRMLELTVADN